MKHFYLLAFLTLSLQAFAQPGDTTIVQTFTFEAQNNPNTAYDSPGRRWFDFPASNNGVNYQKVLMYHTLKCFSDGTAGGLGFPCGEWDYLSYNYLFEHTGALDSTLQQHPHFLLNNQNFTTAAVRATAPFDIFQTEQVVSTINNPADANSFAVGDETESNLLPFGSNETARMQWLYSANELLAAGVQAGNIWQIGFQINGDAGMYQNLKIRLKSTTANALMTFDNVALNTYYLSNTSVNQTGTFYLTLNSPFAWDGSSTILLEVSYDGNPSEMGIASIGEASNMNAIGSIENNKFVRFDGNDEIRIPAEAFASISTEITIAFWLRGDANAQPENGTTFEARNASNNRVLNTHIPWSNSRIYWDAGNSGGSYDRIDKAANPADFEGVWNHWTFTKNSVTGEMKAYLNGVLWHSGTGKVLPMNNITQFSIGAASTWSNFYRGDLDEFCVFGTALSDLEIQSLVANGPSGSNLLVHYTFNNDNNGTVNDASDNGFNGYTLGNPNFLAYAGSELFQSVEPLSFRPKTFFTQGTNVSTTQVSNTINVEVYDAPVSKIEYEIVNHAPQILDIATTYFSRWQFTYNSLGEKIDSTFAAEDQILTNDTLFYYSAPFDVVNRYELGRFITPYGIQLDLGDGWTWIYDVTDFANLLRDSVELEAGNWQELLDLKFVFIEGTPSRDVKRIANVWQGNWGLGGFNNVVNEKTFTLQPNESELKLRTTLTGHGFGNDANNCGEFCYNTHSLNVNGNPTFSWEIMQDCDKNPLFPQGGTWIYARAGWCPGAEGRTEEFELTPFLQNNQVSAEYNITTDPYGNYVTESQVIYYGEKNHAHDPEIEQVLAPSNWENHSRWNPICDNPKFVLRNKGSQPLTEVKISYGVVGGAIEIFTWTGNLGFMESEVVELTYSDPILWNSTSTTGRFVIDLGESANGVDENPSNNHAESAFTRPPVYSYLPNTDNNKLIIIFRTNASHWESAYTLYDINDNPVFTRSFTQPNTTHRDTLQLNAGCYRFKITDTGGDGLSFFANNDGNGYCNLDRVSGAYFKQFENDFGAEIEQYFYWNTNLVGVEEEQAHATQILLMPNPAKKNVKLIANGFDERLTYSLYNIQGQVCKQERINRTDKASSIDIDLNGISAGVYFVKVQDNNNSSTVKLIVE
jgi:hypothetical protein